MSIAKEKLLNGIRVAHLKNTENVQTVSMPVPSRVTIPMIQHLGAPCKSIVKPGDRVLVGQLIGECQGSFYAPIHSSVSGTVKAIDSMVISSGGSCETVIIDTDGMQEISSDVKVPVINSKESFIEAIKQSGLVGLGGAGFPTWVKLNIKSEQKADYLIINAAECEPYITSDYREMLENTDDILAGMAAVKKYLNVGKVIISIEKNKPKAIELFQKLAAQTKEFEVFVLQCKYPKGAEKVIIHDTVGRVVPEGKLPIDVGTIVMNVASVGFVGTYMRTGMPLIQKRITVDGGAITEAKNVMVPIGTSIQDVAEFCGGIKGEARKILMGGPMMGIALYDMDMPIIKNNNAVLFFNEKQAKEQKTTLCIRCGKCGQVCPVRLMPVSIERAFEAKDVERLTALKVNMCVECGCCSFICPAKRPLVQTNRASKKLLRETKK